MPRLSKFGVTREPWFNDAALYNAKFIDDPLEAAGSSGVMDDGDYHDGTFGFTDKIKYDKDGTALDGALKRLCRMMRGVVAATDDKHPDKPGLEAAKTELDFLGKQTNRGPIWHKKLEAAFVPLRPLLSQAPFAAANLALGKVEVPAAGPAAPGGAPAAGGKKEKAADDPDAPDAGRAALYAGLAAFIRCIEMLRDPKSVRAMERLRVGSGGEDAAENPADGLTQKVGRIRAALGIDVSATLPDAIKQANRAMGFDERGSLPEQAARLITALGLQ